ncbi:MAG: Non-reducing end beta-L-arabinofuranosidase [Lentisphaerae bacterium ADurb.BinA184]|nr:MAG: Non-reducing end beta-L-arabinofuranosidase [Lentisphaerae bacterium ADurb.BinA184]
MPMTRIAGTRYAFEGLLAAYTEAVSNRWLKVAPFANPGMLEMFRDRDRRPPRDVVPWAGEFAGKYLTSAVQVLRLTGDAGLHALLQAFVTELVSLQAANGYLGPWPLADALTNHAPQHRETWDTWGHYHLMLGLLLWHEDTGDRAALDGARRIGDLLCDLYLGERTPRLVETGSTEMNLAPAHSLCLLYRQTGDGRHLGLARQLVAEFAARGPDGQPLAGNYLEGPLAGLAFHELPRPRWESLHPILALAELADLTGDARCAEAFARIWHSIARADRHNNGGFSSGEQATGNPYNPAPIETCCTIAWSALSVEMLRRTGDPRVADELELTLYNSILGLHSPSGRWATYNTPMDGVRRAAAHEIVFHAREGTSELNCCSVNSPRGLGMLSDWAVMTDGDALVVNAYAPGVTDVPWGRGNLVRLRQDTCYPLDGQVTIEVSPGEPAEFDVRVRIPRWSTDTRVRVNGETTATAEAGTYLGLRRRWRRGDRIEIEFDFSVHGWRGARECAGKVSLYRGPILLTWDRRYNDHAPDAIPALDPGRLDGREAAWPHWLPPALLLDVRAADGGRVHLCDFASAGNGGSPYISWLPLAPEAGPLREFYAPPANETPG